MYPIITCRLWVLACVFLMVLMGLAGGGAAMAQTYIVKDGKPVAQIVISEKPSRITTLASKELQACIQKISGAKLPIVTAVSDPDAVAIYVGQSTFTDKLGIKTDDLKFGAYRMVSGDRYLVLIGKDRDFVPREPRHSGGLIDYSTTPTGLAWDKLTGANTRWLYPFGQVPRTYNSESNVWENDERGNSNAVYAFLYDLGARWYMPNELGEVLPALSSIALPKVDRTDRPDFGVRYFYQYGRMFGQRTATRDEVLWQLRLGFEQGYTDLIGEEFGYSLSHGLTNVLWRAETFEAHPDWFALYNGKRDRYKPCLSSPGLRAEVLKWARFMFDQYDVPMVSLMPSDGYSYVCGCPLCEGKGTPERPFDGQLSDYVWEFVNSTATELYKTHPTRKVSCFAYGAYLLTPRKIDMLSPNIVLGICQTRMTFNDPGQKTKYVDELRRDWLSKLPEGDNKLLMYDYYFISRDRHPNEHMPAFYPRQIARDIRELKGKAWGEFTEVTRSDEPGDLTCVAINHLNLYITAKLWWNPDLNVDALLEEYYTLFYGPARNEMKAYIEHGEANWPYFGKDPVKIGESLALIDKAVKAAPADTIYAKRIKLIADYVKPMTDLAQKIARGRENVPEATTVIRNGTTIKIDGKLDEPQWQKLNVERLKDLKTGREPVLPTSFKAFWSDENRSLYLGIECTEVDDQKLNIGSTKDGDQAIFMGDTIELLLETQGHAYYQLVFSPSGALASLDRKDGRINSTWDSRVQVAATRTPTSWTLEIRIPAVAEPEHMLDPKGDGLSGSMPTKTQPWFINLCRQRVRDDGSQYSAWSPTGAATFHNLEKFGRFYVR